MIKRMKVQSSQKSEESFFDRQALLSWWDQAAIAKARIMVVGAGALGNETLKNLLLLGVNKIAICDFDNIETSNLSRTVLFSPADLGKSKAHVAAERARAMSLSDNPEIVSFHGDITSELGLGFFRNADIVLGCVDNIEARRFINRVCRMVGKPWIDSGINELAGHVSFYSPHAEACYECALSSHQLAKSRERYSCDDVKKKSYSAAKVATVQITSSIISGLQVQECMKYLNGRPVTSGHRIWFDGATNRFEVFGIQSNPDCEMHVSLGQVVECGLRSESSLEEALDYLAHNGFGPNPTIDNSLLGLRQFVEEAPCRLCDRPIRLRRPLSSLSEEDLICNRNHDDSPAVTAQGPISKRTIDVFSAKTTGSDILAGSLNSIGICRGDIIGVRDTNGNTYYIELSEDVAGLWPARAGGQSP